MRDFLPYLLAAGIYLGIGALYWRRTLVDSIWPQVGVSLALAIHGWLLHRSLFVADGINLGLTNALSAILWLTALIYWGTNLRHDLHRLQAFVLPPAALCVLLQGLYPGTHLLAYADQPLFRLHLAIAFAAYSLFTFAALHAVLMAMAERSLHHKTPLVRLPDFPPIMPMERLLFQIITAGFVLLTLTVVSGVFFTEQIFGKPLQFNHKTIFSIAAWCIFGGLLWGRRSYGWRGRVAVRWTLGGFVLLLLAYLGTRFVLEILLGR